MQYTDEQLAIISRDIEPEEIIKVVAFAGTGKTSTLYGYTDKRPKTNFLYMCFNKSVQVSAEKKFPKNTVCKTSHSLAWKGFGSIYRHKLGKDNVKAIHVAQALGINNLIEAKMVLDTVNRYIISADPTITDRHLPSVAWRLLGATRLGKCLGYAEQVWDIMTNENNLDLGITHDAYFKLFALANPPLDFDVLLIDEAQDINPILASYLLRKNKPLVLIGDPRQAIYGFRGAINIMDQIKSDETYYLTQSFRFPKVIGDLANQVLHTFTNEKKVIRTIGGKDGRLRSVSDRRHTLIARTNSELFVEAAKLIGSRKIAFLGGVKNYNFEDLVDAYYLYSGQNQRIRSPYIRGFDKYKNMKDYAVETEDQELISRCRVVERFKGSIPVFVHRIKEASSIGEQEADVLLTTVHKSKGLEYQAIRLANDHHALVKKGVLLGPNDIKAEEVNIIYVGITRTMGDLEVPQKMQDFIDVLQLDARMNHPMAGGLRF